ADADAVATPRNAPATRQQLGIAPAAAAAAAALAQRGGAAGARREQQCLVGRRGRAPVRQGRAVGPGRVARLMERVQQPLQRVARGDVRPSSPGPGGGLRLNSLGLRGRLSPLLGNLSFLTELDLGNNGLAGWIPPQLGSLRRLQLLNLSMNSLEGDIPRHWGVAPASQPCLSATTASAARSRRGEIPASVANLTSIQELRLGYNSLSGAIPPSLGALPNLSALVLYFNNLSGTLPDALWNISSLTELTVSGNDLTGTIPSDVFDRVPRMRYLRLSINRFHGRIPSSISNASNLLGGLKKLNFVALYFNSLEAKEPKDWAFMASLANCSQLETLELDSNNFAGELPSSISNLSTSLQWLTLSGNQISGAIPEQISNLVSLQALALESNSLSGPLPSSLSMIQGLQYLSLSGNNFWGDIQWLGNLTQLHYLYIGACSFNGSIPTTLGNLTSLLEFDLSRNSFTGSIPPSLLKIPTLTNYLDISYNLLEGPIPFEIGNLKTVSVFHAESNRLSGEIPSTIGQCQLLENLYLQDNLLSGALPQQLSALRNLEILDLSNNNFTGQIPKFLGNMSALLYLNLSSNNFTGEVPNFGVFKNASAFSIHGDAKLCGGISELHLPSCPSDLPKKKKKIPVIPIVVPIVATLSILLFLYFLIIRNKKRSTGSPSITPMTGHPQVAYWQLVRATDGFSEANLLGAGTFGSVYKGRLDEDNDETANFAAVKVLKLQIPGAVKSFVAECDAMKNIRHRNLVRIITACSSIDSKGDDFKAILREWLHPGTDDQSGERQLSLLQRVDILFDVAYALDYLHFHGASPIVHCDLKPSNVLLDSNMVAHVGDFGLARILAEGCSSYQIATNSMGFRGTIGYAPPEYGAGNIVSTHGDMYSYGILLLEMLTRRRPTDNAFDGALGLRGYVETSLNSNVMDIIDVELLGELENDRAPVHGPSSSRGRRMDWLISLLKLGLLCSVETPSSRLTTKEIIKELNVIKDGLANREQGQR
ncbi:hypothetical protein EJB05_20629, partial [Eragrostis curvula]